MMTCKSIINSNFHGRCTFTLLLAFFFLMLSVAVVHGSINQKIQETITLLKSEDYAGAILVLHELEEALPNPADINHLWATAYLGRGYQLLAAGEFANAREHFQAGQQYREDDVRLWQGEAMAWFKEGRYAEAVLALEQAIAYEHGNADIYHLLGRAYYAAGRMPEAIDALQQATQLSQNEIVESLYQKVRQEWLVEQEMQQDYRGHFQLSYVNSDRSSALASAVLATLEDAYAELGSDLNFYPDVTVPVLIYTRSEYSAVTGSPDWSGAVYDGKIRLPLAGVVDLNEHLAAVLYHEYMHVLVHFLAHHYAPVWLNEGLAEIAGRRIASPLPANRQKLDRETLLDWQELSKPFAALPSSEVPLAYEQSYLLTTYMIESYGWHRMTELLMRLGKRQDWLTAVAAVYESFGLDWPAILREWQASLN